MRRVLVTGATGLIGRATVSALLEAGCAVTALSRGGTPVGGAEELGCDLTNSDAVDRALATARSDTLVHLAWLSGAARWHGAENLSWVRHSLFLVERFAAAGGHRVVGAGSCAEYDWSVPTMNETTPLRPTTAYGAAKAATGLALCGAGPALGLTLAWARIFFVFGPGEPRGRLFGDLIQGLSAGETVTCTDGAQKRDFLHVNDLGRALATLALNEGVTGPINIAHGTPIAVRTLIEEVALQLDASERVQLGARPRAEGDPPLLAADVTRMNTALGPLPRQSWPDAVAAVLAEDLRK